MLKYQHCFMSHYKCKIGWKCNFMLIWTHYASSRINIKTLKWNVNNKKNHEAWKRFFEHKNLYFYDCLVDITCLSFFLNFLWPFESHVTVAQEKIGKAWDETVCTVCLFGSFHGLNPSLPADKAWMVIQHNNTELTKLKASSGMNQHLAHFNYSADTEQIRAIITQAEYCEQELSYHCKKSRLLNTPGKPFSLGISIAPTICKVRLIKTADARMTLKHTAQIDCYTLCYGQFILSYTPPPHFSALN